MQPTGSCIYAFYPPDPLNAPRSNKCGRLLKNNLELLKKKKKVSALKQFSLHRKAFFFFFFSRCPFPIFFFFFRQFVLPPKNGKVNRFFFFFSPIESLERDYLAPPPLFSTGTGGSSLSASPGGFAAALRKNAVTNPFSRHPPSRPAKECAVRPLPRGRAGSCTSFSTVLGGTENLMVFP